MHSPYDEPANQNDPNADLLAVQNFRGLDLSSRWEMNSAVHFRPKDSVGQAARKQQHRTNTASGSFVNEAEAVKFEQLWSKLQGDKTKHTPTNWAFMLMLTFSRIYRYVFLAGLVIVIYDHLLTFSKEVKYIWLTKLRPSTCWFLAAKYIGLIGNIIVSVFYFGALSHESCIRMLTVWEIFIISQEVLIETTLSIRGFAMYGRNMWVLVPLLALVCTSGILAVVGAVKLDGPAQNLAAPGLNGCNTPYPRSTVEHLAKAWMVMSVHFNFVRRGWSLTARLIQTRLRCARVRVDGPTSIHAASYIAAIRRLANPEDAKGRVIVLATIANISTFYNIPLIRNRLRSLATLMLNLHEAGAGRIDTLELNTLDLVSIQFTATMMGTTVDEEY
ncbi:hypothetical protein C8J57DRAFT_1244924 [Mycena rebaudengoi]|nr:hypothetical protein C8J57DRAFT_1244924 [Mycena rebaudengoi]